MPEYMVGGSFGLLWGYACIMSYASANVCIIICKYGSCMVMDASPNAYLVMYAWARHAYGNSPGLQSASQVIWGN